MKQRNLFTVQRTRTSCNVHETPKQVKTQTNSKQFTMTRSRVNSAIHDKIRQRRLQMLVHSCLYYQLNTSIVSDKQFDEWARELVELQQTYAQQSKEVEWYEQFIGWDATTGYYLPLTDPWVVGTAKALLAYTQTGGTK